MTDTDETKRPKTLSLKKTETSTVKQSFSHGRTKAVVVEKKRTLGAPAPAKAASDKPARTDKPAAGPVMVPASQPESPAEETPEPVKTAEKPATPGEVVSLDSFRKK